ncbi:putative nicotinate-nucleotide pyrophosphorylase [carboxylating] [Methanimicrococcus sp. At1]|uniref:Nicotinate-nucleotide pyrophosphorylase [carboxylating] n=1 Tax=Methanimicrococcus hacksteinii TaxID=3028293 RepID=A0ABU3VSA2_9EURY|nr:carboxylating nicotinate-nucleotide diphosphorylase [Methanimicrococcus sp. At1]MDV0446169.1 putative nicotinate-nucleotide pyrophosphorylase [carboxylating] [Methanimicrococcus sp. At1]
MILQKEIEHFLEEDLREDDVSCTLVGNENVRAVIFVKEDCVVSGLEIASAILEYMKISYVLKKKPGEKAKAGDVLYELNGDSVSILRVERLVLNFLSHLSGIAANTRDYVQIAADAAAAAGIHAPKIAATRKTTPGIRKFEKKAVLDGGGDPHRQSLSDTVMIKDNHIEIMGLENAFKEAKRQTSFTKKIEIEADTKEQAVLAAELGADIILLDNMTPDQIRDVIALLEQKNLRNRVILEASGGIRKENLKEYAATGANVISLSAVTNDADWIDVGLDIVK